MEFPARDWYTTQQRVPGNKGETAMPTAAVVLTLFARVTMVHVMHSG